MITHDFKRLRKACGLTIEDVARGAGVVVSTVWRFERGLPTAVDTKANIIAVLLTMAERRRKEVDRLVFLLTGVAPSA
jgi:transcriptional regulator with XRE-family HTH domain